eukprot:scaffold27248_cov62-Phaeocystis_antarctica.AAC.1
MNARGLVVHASRLWLCMCSGPHPAPESGEDRGGPGGVMLSPSRPAARAPLAPRLPRRSRLVY